MVELRRAAKKNLSEAVLSVHAELQDPVRDARGRMLGPRTGVDLTEGALRRAYYRAADQRRRDPAYAAWLDNALAVLRSYLEQRTAEGAAPLVLTGRIYPPPK